MLKVVAVTPLVVTLESTLGSEAEGFKDALNELKAGKPVNDFALAECGVPGAVLSLANNSPYPVDRDGRVIEEGNPPPGTLYRYRIDVAFSRPR